ncbi:MAG TPA: DEAD/DEAH box helicase, partial [Turneriella sp.]|nr:DEAD/DEAH box helicase [Turneriella sp.]
MVSLPVASIVNELKVSLERTPAVLLTADTGSGKTTWLPLQLLDAAWLKGKKIVMLEPRRVAARAAAMRLAHHLGESVGNKVGYSVRLDSRTSAVTRLEVVTEGVLARRLVNDPELADVGLLIFDEFHERHIETDLALALALESMRVFRPDLKILIMSATIDTTKITTFLQNVLTTTVPCIVSQGTNFPVAIHYAGDAPQPTHFVGDNYAHVALWAARQAIQAHKLHKGDILVFLPGKSEIKTAIEFITAHNLPQTKVLPLHGELTPQEQDDALKKGSTLERRIIVATPIAESSITVDGLAGFGARRATAGD